MSAFQTVIARPPEKRIISSITEQSVIAEASKGPIVVRTARDPIVALLSVQVIVLSAAVDGVRRRAALNVVSGPSPTDLIAPLVAADPISFAEPSNNVVTCAGNDDVGFVGSPIRSSPGVPTIVARPPKQVGCAAAAGLTPAAVRNRQSAGPQMTVALNRFALICPVSNLSPPSAHPT